jgi:hypothetical protein
MAHRSWNESYAAGELPWDTGERERRLSTTVGPLKFQRFDSIVELLVSGRELVIETINEGRPAALPSG